jgi:hypothetical protein
MPARHTSLQDIPLLEAVSNPAALVDERGCRRDIRSNGWIVLSKELALAKTGPAEGTSSFVRCGPLVRNFIGPKALHEIWS